LILSQDSYDLLLRRCDLKKDKFYLNPIAAREPVFYGRTKKEKVHSFNKDSKSRDNDICKVIRCRATRNGDGGTDYKGQRICVDSGLLCVAHCNKGFGKRYWGVKFPTENSALNALEKFANII
jgi:hypothetical protein